MESKTSQFNHIPVLLNEVISGLNLKPNGKYVDATVGGAGHAIEILKNAKNAKLYAFDRDETAIEISKSRLEKYKTQVKFFNSNYKDMPTLLEIEKGKLDGILVDLGVSSYQIDTNERGFSFKEDAPLDMRMDESQEFSAIDVINDYSVQRLSEIIFEYGEEKFSRRIAANIEKQRKIKRITTTGELANIIRKSVPGDPLKNLQRTFQAIRIEVNDELTDLDKFFTQAVDLLKSGGRMAVITFHSLEDRIAKNVFKLLSTDCICPPKTPVCICGHKATIKLINKKPITADEEEARRNSRSTCAKLRIIEKL